MVVVGADTKEALAGISAGDLSVLDGEVELSELDGRTFALVKIAALIADEAPPASYAWQVANALEEGATAEDLLGVLRAIAPQVGGPRVIAAAHEITLAMGLAARATAWPEGARLREVGRLHEQGILTDEEFADEKARILGTG